MPCCGCCCRKNLGECCGPNPDEQVCCKPPDECCGEGETQVCCKIPDICCGTGESAVCCPPERDCCTVYTIGEGESEVCCAESEYCCFSEQFPGQGICCDDTEVCCLSETGSSCCEPGQYCCDGACQDEPCEEPPCIGGVLGTENYDPVLVNCPTGWSYAGGPPDRCCPPGWTPHTENEALTGWCCPPGCAQTAGSLQPAGTDCATVEGFAVDGGVDPITGEVMCLQTGCRPSSSLGTACCPDNCVELDPTSPCYDDAPP